MTRIEEIRNLLFHRKKVLVNDLSSHYDVSTVTIRKDLALLEDEGVARRIYGGAVLASGALSQAIDISEDKVLAQLAELACSEIEDGDSIFLGSGRTCCCLAKLLHRFSNLSIVTNNITALGDLLEMNARVYLLGGEVTSTDAHTLFASPDNPEDFTDKIFVNKAFTSVSGIDLRAGVTVHSVISTYIYKHLPSIARSWYLMADSNKFDKIAMYPVAELSDVACVITDRISNEYANKFKENNTILRILG